VTLPQTLAERITAIARPHPVRVAIDGVDAAGKTTLADALKEPIEACGLAVIRASIDDFHRAREERYRQGEESPQGYYDDSFEYEAVRDLLLAPLGPGGNRRYVEAVFDFKANIPRLTAPRLAPRNAVLLFDGIFLLRPELNDLWDFRVFLQVDFEETLRRATERDEKLFGSREAVRRRYLRRYVPAQRLYLDSVRPELIADVVVTPSPSGFKLNVSP
jgi:uridine kinase